jgi:hypothetical protein
MQTVKRRCAQTARISLHKYTTSKSMKAKQTDAPDFPEHLPPYLRIVSVARQVFLQGLHRLGEGYLRIAPQTCKRKNQSIHEKVSIGKKPHISLKFLCAKFIQSMLEQQLLPRIHPIRRFPHG